MRRAALLALCLAAAAPAVADEAVEQTTSSQSRPAPPPDGTKPAAPCLLQRAASLDMQTLDSGLVTVPVTIGGVHGRWIVDTGNVRSMIVDSLADRLNLKRFDGGRKGVMMGGIAISQYAFAPGIDFAGLRSVSTYLDIIPEDSLDTDAIGMLAPDIMRRYDVEFDFANGMFNVFLPHRCPGTVYWTKGNYAKVPFHLDLDGHIVVNVTLDGKPLAATIDTGAQGSVMSMHTARLLFGLDENAQGMEALGDHTINGLASTTAYRYPFHALGLDGVAVSDPNITIVKDTGFAEAQPTLVIGIETLRQLHIYIAYGEGALYITPAEQR